MEKYRRVERPPLNAEPMADNEIRITQQGKIRNYISYAVNLFTREENQVRSVVLKAMGRAINKSVTVCEITKRRVSGLHQITEINSLEVVDAYEPLEEGLDRVEITRHVPSLQITLSLDALDDTNPGYQPPLDESQVSAYDEEIAERSITKAGRGRGKGKGKGKRGGRGYAGKGKGKGKGKGNSYQGRGRGRGRGKGKGKGKGQGRGKGF